MTKQEWRFLFWVEDRVFDHPRDIAQFSLFE